MTDCVIDATIIGLSNDELANRVQGNSLDHKLQIVEQVTSGIRRVRYNSKLLNEYERLVGQYQNDVIHLFFIILDSPRAFRVGRNSLSRQHHASAVNDCGWPSHDQHLIAAALDGIDPSIFVTEFHHAICASRIWRHFAIRIEHIQ